MNVAHIAQPAPQPIGTTSILGDPKAGTRLAGRDTWVLEFGAQAGDTLYASLADAHKAAQALSDKDAPAVALLKAGDKFAVHAVQFGLGPNDPAPQLGAFALDNKHLAALSTGGYLGDFPFPKDSPLLALVDGTAAAHLDDTGPFGKWGFEDGLPGQ